MSWNGLDLRQLQPAWLIHTLFGTGSIRTNFSGNLTFIQVACLCVIYSKVVTTPFVSEISRGYTEKIKFCIDRAQPFDSSQTSSSSVYDNIISGNLNSKWSNTLPFRFSMVTSLHARMCHNLDDSFEPGENLLISTLHHYNPLFTLFLN